MNGHWLGPLLVATSLVLVAPWLPNVRLAAHPPAPDGRHAHEAPTFQLSGGAELPPDARRLVLRILETPSCEETAARVMLHVDGRPYVPGMVGRHGLRFVSIHTAKRQRATILYARGSGPLEIPLPEDATRGEVVVTKGYEFVRQRVRFEIASPRTSVTVRLRRWSNIRGEGWRPADEHLHYERLDPDQDRHWLAMLDADDLSHACFMVLKGGNLPGIWAQQHAYGERGQATDGARLLVPGEEFRDSWQGHINLLGLGKVIEPISTGGIGRPPYAYHDPPLHDVFLQARRSGGIGGPAHGGALARRSTAVVDTVLGAAEFFEIANTHLYKTDVWYRLLNCGYVLPPAAGTDLPNFPYRDPWQPFLGETRMYVRVGEDARFDAFKKAIRRGEVFVSSGPIPRLQVNGVGPGGTVRLPAGGEIEIEAELACAQPLQALEIVRSGVPVKMPPQKRAEDGVHRWTIRGRVRVTQSCWIAARGRGVPKHALQQQLGIQQNAMAHTAAVRVLVDDQPITSADDANFLIAQLAEAQRAYRTDARFRRAEDRVRMLQLFDRAMDRLAAAAE